MTRGRLAVHGHFYQPSRIDPFTGEAPVEPSAAPYHDWNARVSAEAYRPNAERHNYDRISWDLGPTLAAWLERGDPVAYRGFVEADRPAERDPAIPAGRGNGMAQPFHHSILPLASAADRRTEIRWGIRDFRQRFGRMPEGIWLPETAVDLSTLRAAAEEGMRYTILAPWQAVGTIDPRQPYRVELGGGRSIVVAFYDAGLSAAVSFEPEATADADRFARERVAVRLAAGAPDDPPPLALIATDGELYGHHQTFRDLFLQRLIRPGPDVPDRGFDVIDLASALVEPTGRPFRTAKIAERTSWSCHHGVLRWTAECPDARDGRWKGPLRAALERLAGGIDVTTEEMAGRLPGDPDPWDARDAYADVVLGIEPPAAFAATWLADDATTEERAAWLGLMEAHRWRLAMFASDGWFWDDPIRPETKQVMRAAARAARLVDGLAGGGLERRLVEDLALFSSPGHGIDGAAIYRTALAEIGQPASPPDPRPVAGHTSARGLRTTG
ncbi:MAG: DUF3536 domain-containing protein [Chloroflexota bacterium]